MTVDGKINSRGTKDILGIMTTSGGDPEEIAIKENKIQQNDEGPLKELAQKYIDAHPSVVAEFKAGKEASLMFFVGQIMKETKGSANPAIIQKILRELMQ
jgi:aspartyl-tRNA(Asn)/glutamyl-tRNA(Gln) amidotransferase subunit B